MSVNNTIFAPTTTHHDAIMALTASNILNISVKVTRCSEIRSYLNSIYRIYTASKLSTLLSSKL